MLIKKIPSTSKLIATRDFSRITKINFNVRMAEVSKNLAAKNHK